MFHNKIFSLEEILPKINIGSRKIKLFIDNQKFLVKANSPRLLCFKRSNVCYLCGLAGNIFVLEFSKGWNERKINVEKHPHLNLYHRHQSGKLTLFTKDHLIPKSWGGKDSLDNLNTCCRGCNNEKQNSLDFKKFPKLIDFFV